MRERKCLCGACFSLRRTSVRLGSNRAREQAANVASGADLQVCAATTLLVPNRAREQAAGLWGMCLHPRRREPACPRSREATGTGLQLAVVYPRSRKATGDFSPPRFEPRASASGWIVGHASACGRLQAASVRTVRLQQAGRTDPNPPPRDTLQRWTAQAEKSSSPPRRSTSATTATKSATPHSAYRNFR